MRGLSRYPDGTVFRAGATSYPTVGLMSILNGEDEKGACEPIHIDGWGYDRGSEAYRNAGRIGREFKKLARRPHRVDCGDRRYELTFEAIPDTRNDTQTYRMQKAILGEVVELQKDAA